jgi:hypothetical protein
MAVAVGCLGAERGGERVDKRVRWEIEFQVELGRDSKVASGRSYMSNKRHKCCALVDGRKAEERDERKKGSFGFAVGEVTWNISPAPSQSDEVMIGVLMCT